MGSTRNTSTIFETTTKNIRPGFSCRPCAATPSSRAHSSISLRLRKLEHCCQQEKSVSLDMTMKDLRAA